MDSKLEKSKQQIQETKALEDRQHQTSCIWKRSKSSPKLGEMEQAVAGPGNPAADASYVHFLEQNMTAKMEQTSHY